jgi:hypothetical protein
MKKLLILVNIYLGLVAAGQEGSRISDFLSDEELKNRDKERIVENSNMLSEFREELRSSLPMQEAKVQNEILKGLKTFDKLIEEKDVKEVPELMPFITWLYMYSEEHSEDIFKTSGDPTVQGNLNYFIESFLSPELNQHKPEDVSEQTLQAMIHFWAGNPAQTCEGSWTRCHQMMDFWTSGH